MSQPAKLSLSGCRGFCSLGFSPKPKPFRGHWDWRLWILLGVYGSFRVVVAFFHIWYHIISHYMWRYNVSYMFRSMLNSWYMKSICKIICYIVIYMDIYMYIWHMIFIYIYIFKSAVNDTNFHASSYKTAGYYMILWYAIRKIKMVLYFVLVSVCMTV